MEENSVPEKEVDSAKFHPQKSPANLILIVIIAMLILYIGGATYYLIRSGAFKPKSNAAPAVQPVRQRNEIVFISGTAYRLVNGNWKVVTENTEITQSDTIKTDINSRLAIRFTDGSSVRLDENTQIYFPVLNGERISVKIENGKSFLKLYGGYDKYLLTAGDYSIKPSKAVLSVSTNPAPIISVYKGRVLAENTVGAVQIVANEQWRAETNLLENMLLQSRQADTFVQWCLDEENIFIMPTPPASNG